MPTKNSMFNLGDSSLKSVFPEMGVLMVAEGEKGEAQQTVILGGYYDSREEVAGLYIPRPDGEVDYFDLEIVNVIPQGDGRLVRFDYDGKNYLMRPFYMEDGQWISKYGIELPKSVLENKTSLDSHNALEKFTGVDMGEPFPFFEGLYAYYIPTNDVIMSIMYMSTGGTFMRSDSSWLPTQPDADYYQGLAVLEIQEEGAKELLDNYDKKRGIVSVEEVKKVSVASE